MFESVLHFKLVYDVVIIISCSINQMYIQKYAKNCFYCIISSIPTYYFCEVNYQFFELKDKLHFGAIIWFNVDIKPTVNS